MPTVLEGDAAVAALARALARVTALVPYLGASIDPHDLPPPHRSATDRAFTTVAPAEGEWLASSALIDDPARLGAIVRAAGRALGTADPVVAASAFIQGYSYRVLTLAVACLTSGAVVPDSSAPHMAVALSGPWPSLIAYRTPRTLVLDGPAPPTDAATITVALRFVVDTAVVLHLQPLIGALRTGLDAPVGERLLWGNVAASAATAFRTMAGCLGPSVEPLGARFFSLVPPALGGHGSFLVIEVGPDRGWFWERTTCCLFDRLPDGVRCADCSLTPPAQRRRAYRATLRPSGADTGGG